MSCFCGYFVKAVSYMDRLFFTVPMLHSHQIILFIIWSQKSRLRLVSLITYWLGSVTLFLSWTPTTATTGGPSQRWWAFTPLGHANSSLQLKNGNLCVQGSFFLRQMCRTIAIERSLKILVWSNQRSRTQKLRSVLWAKNKRKEKQISP